MRYYNVALNTKRHLKSPTYTYSHTDTLPPGTLVRAPFGSKTKPGIILETTEKPAFKTREFQLYDDVVVSSHTRAFVSWYESYYAARGGQAYSQLLPEYLTKKRPKLPKEKTFTHTNNVDLNTTQTAAKQSIQRTKKPIVLHGITGSGKTRLYISLILDVLARGQSALLLYPEIALTTQISREIEKHAPVAAFHSGMTAAQRSKLWFRIATQTQPMVVIGARSALFLPHTNLGVIIVDEAHESTYKQETDVRYNGLLVAGGLARSHDAQLILGSATPPITETEQVVSQGGVLVCMHEQAITNDHTKKTVVINRTDSGAFRSHHMISDPLLDAMRAALEKQEQSLLFINRRGTAKLVLCDECGWSAVCPECDLPVTYHHDVHALLCHTCGSRVAVPTSCPECSHHVSMRSLGSKAIVDDVKSLLPSARIERFDTDTSQPESFAERYNDIRDGRVDILVGTQQIAKGLDLPRLSVVGVLNADLSLHFPDYSSEERTFQLLAQVAGRVGRGHADGTIYIQTLHPKNTAIQQALSEDWHSFRDQELTSRRTHQLPPYTFAAKVLFRDTSYDAAFTHANTYKTLLRRHLPETELLIDGPLPSFIQKRGGQYYAQIHLRSVRRSVVLRAVRAAPDTAFIDLDPHSFL